MTPEPTMPIQILVVDDDPGDVKLMKMTWSRSKIWMRVHVVKDGEEALRYLRRQGSYATASRPDLVLLDLNMPRKDGRETLTEIKQDPALHGIPVVILTTSESDEDIARSYAAGANAYVTKPIELHEFNRMVQAVDDFWLTVVKLPAVDGE